MTCVTRRIRCIDYSIQFQWITSETVLELRLNVFRLLLIIRRHRPTPITFLQPRPVIACHENPQPVRRLLCYSLMFRVGNGSGTWFEGLLSPVNYPTSTTDSDVLSSTIVSPYAPGQNSAQLLSSATMNYVGNGSWTPFEVYFLFRSLSDITGSLCGSPYDGHTFHDRVFQS